MFTGLIEEQGTVRSTKFSDGGMEITIDCGKILSDVKTGRSVCVDGVCQSVVSFSGNSVTFQISNETLKISNFKNLKQGRKVNLERALTLNSRLDGHIVSGHIDCTAEFLYKTDDGFSQKLFFEIPESKMKYIIYKGSISINGASLTIASAEKNKFSVELIPLTLKETNLSALKPGDIVNIETDMIAKYVEKIFNSKDNTSKINFGFLEENGFV